MRAGRLRHVVTIQQRSTAQDSSGALDGDWVDVATVRAEVRSPAGLERVQAGMEQTVATVTHTVRMRKEVTVLPSMRVVWEGKILQVVSVMDPDNLGVQLLLNCYEVVEPVRV